MRTLPFLSKLSFPAFVIALSIAVFSCASGPAPRAHQNDADSEAAKKDADESVYEEGVMGNYPSPAQEFAVRGSLDPYTDKAGLRTRLNGIYKQSGIDVAKPSTEKIYAISEDYFKQGRFADSRLLAKDAGDLDPEFGPSWYIRAASIARLYKKPAEGDFDYDQHEIAFSLDMALYSEPSLLDTLPADKNFDNARSTQAFRKVVEKYRLVKLSEAENLKVIFLAYHRSEMEFDFNYMRFKVADTGEILGITDFDPSVLGKFYITDERIENPFDPKTGEPIFDFPPDQPGGVLPCRIILSVQPGGEYAGGFDEEYSVLDTHLKLEYAKPW